MKKLHQYMMILVAGVLSACGSMAVNDPYVEALPEGFNAQEYMSLHPELRARQLKDYVADYNSQFKTSLGKDYDAVKKADDAAFLQDTERLGAIYTHPQIGAHSYEQWADLIAQMSSADSTANEIFNSLAEYNFINVADDAALLLTVPVDYVAISQQFNVFGREHGWAYRACRADEAANPARSSLEIAKKQASRATSAAGFTPDTGLYCRDAAGVDRLIQ
ncbi:hypothetical protein B7982_12025 [Fibrobacter sp. UWB2]|uniref:hypothetical protein n=1 Tax=Fibrobacter sp. UWB2 TaxID=1964358 RepID=UPI000B5254F3|nr:hypothetical protein [Fibrobacter sp. UWB2]OWV21825.1 hypothetical protein B7982_12025 [Fibrobacter sp. UWB2]